MLRYIPIPVRLHIWKPIIHGVLSRQAQVVFQESFDTPNWRIARGTINSPGTEKRWLAWLGSGRLKGPAPLTRKQYREH